MPDKRIACPAFLCIVLVLPCASYAARRMAGRTGGMYGIVHRSAIAAKNIARFYSVCTHGVYIYILVRTAAQRTPEPCNIYQRNNADNQPCRSNTKNYDPLYAHIYVLAFFATARLIRSTTKTAMPHIATSDPTKSGVLLYQR